MLLIRLQQRPLFGFLVNPFCTPVRAIKLADNESSARLAPRLSVLRLAQTEIIAKECP